MEIRDCGALKDLKGLEALEMIEKGQPSVRIIEGKTPHSHTHAHTYARTDARLRTRIHACSDTLHPLLLFGVTAGPLQSD